MRKRITSTTLAIAVAVGVPGLPVASSLWSTSALAQTPGMVDAGEAQIIMVRAKVTAPLGTQDLAVVVGAYFEDLWHEHRKTLLKLWGFTESNSKGSSQATPHKKLAELPASELARCLIDCVLVGELRGSAWNASRPTRLLTLAGRYRINPKAIKRQTDVEFKDKAKATTSKKRKS